MAVGPATNLIVKLDTPAVNHVLWHDGTQWTNTTSPTLTSLITTGDITTGGNLIIPDAGWIGSVTTNQAIQIEADGDVVMPQMLAVTGDIQVTGNLSIQQIPSNCIRM